MTAVVTGGSSGIGEALCKLLCEKGYRVFCLARREGPTCAESIETDLTDEASVSAAFEKIAAASPHIDLLVNNAGMGISGAAEFTDIAEAKRQFDVNFFAVLRTLHAAAPLLSGGGRIINVSSAAAVFAIPYQSLYSASKAALNSLTLAMRSELAPFGISVCAVMPGDVRTGFTGARRKSAEGEEKYAGRIKRSVAVMENDERSGMTPEKIARAVYALSRRRRVKPLRAVGAQYRLFCVLAKLLPTSAVNFIVGKMYIKQ